MQCLCRLVRRLSIKVLLKKVDVVVFLHVSGGGLEELHLGAHEVIVLLALLPFLSGFVGLRGIHVGWPAALDVMHSSASCGHSISVDLQARRENYPVLAVLRYVAER